MDKSTSRKEIANQLWPTVGPLLAFCLSFVLLFNPSATPVGLPLITLCGLLACYAWKWRGVAISSVSLAALLTYYLYQQPHSLWIWTIVLSLSIASIFVVTVLCFEEASVKWENLCKRVRDYKQTVTHLNEKIHAERKLLLTDQEGLSKQIEKLQHDISLTEGKMASDELLGKLAHEELAAAYLHQEKILQELFQARKETVSLSASLEQLQECMPKEGSNDKDESLVAEIEQLRFMLQDVEAKERIANEKAQQLLNELEVVQKTRQKLADSEEKIKAINDSHQLIVEEYTVYIDKIAEEQRRQETALVAAGERAQKEQQEHQESLKKFADEQRRLEAALEAAGERTQHEQRHREESEKRFSDERHEMQVALAQLKVENEQLQAAPKESVDVKEMRRLDGLYRQLREQFVEKTEVLAATRRELFSAQERLAALQKDVEESRVNEAKDVDISLQQLLAEAESELQNTEAEHAAEVARLHEVIDSLMAYEQRA
ncbi:MAG: hypothetical protein WCG42_00325 [Parachlamydiaceae bacterium]